MDLIKLKKGDRRSLSRTISMVEKGEITSTMIKESFPEIKSAEISAILKKQLEG